MFVDAWLYKYHTDYRHDWTYNSGIVPTNMLVNSDSNGACYNVYVDETISQDPNFNEVKRWLDGNLNVNWKNKTAAHYYYNCLANSGQLKPDDRILGASPILSALFVQFLDICWAFLWIEDAESSQEAQGIFETTADLPADLFQVRLQHILVEIFSCCLQIYTSCKVCDCVMGCGKVLLIIGTFLDLL